MTRAILIDPAERSFREVFFSHWTEIAPLLGCARFDGVRFKDCSGFVDDEGLLKNPSDIRWTLFDGRALAGSLLLVGKVDENGDETHCPLSIEEAERRTRFGLIRPKDFVDSLLRVEFVPL